MNKSLGLFLALTALFLVSSVAEAKPTVKCEVLKVSEHKLLVTFEWRVSILSDKAWDGCDLRISFQDSKGQEIFFCERNPETEGGAQRIFRGGHLQSGRLETSGQICDHS